MNTARLLHAAARGARIQQHVISEGGGWWYTTQCVYYGYRDLTFRIHPEDAHLAYGPISTALRKRAETGSFEFENPMHQMAWFSYVGQWCFDDEAQVQWYCLFSAEALADIGL